MCNLHHGSCCPGLMSTASWGSSNSSGSHDSLSICSSYSSSPEIFTNYVSTFFSFFASHIECTHVWFARNGCHRRWRSRSQFYRKSPTIFPIVRLNAPKSRRVSTRIFRIVKSSVGETCRKLSPQRSRDLWFHFFSCIWPMPGLLHDKRRTRLLHMKKKNCRKNHFQLNRLWIVKILTFSDVFFLGQAKIDFAANLFRWHRRHPSDDHIGVLFNESFAFRRHFLWHFTADFQYTRADFVLCLFILQLGVQSRHYQFADRALWFTGKFGIDCPWQTLHSMAR